MCVGRGFALWVFDCVCLIVISFSPASVAHSRMRLRYHLVVGEVVGRVKLVGCVLLLALASAS